MGQLDKEQLFYMKTRGFSLQEAQNLLVKGFCKEVLEMVTLPSLHEIVSAKADDYLSKRL